MLHKRPQIHISHHGTNFFLSWKLQYIVKDTLLIFQVVSEEATSMQSKFGKIKETVETLKQEPCLSEEERKNVEEDAEELCVRYSLVVENCRAKKTM